MGGCDTVRDISHMESVIVKSLQDKIEKLIEAQRKTAKKMWEDTINNCPTEDQEYLASIQVSDTEIKDNVIKTSVYSDLLVGGTNPKWVNVPRPAFYEWGTGPLGEDTNTYGHGYPYTTDEPWNEEARKQFQETGTWGMEARPHFYPALQGNIGYYKENIRKALKE